MAVQKNASMADNSKTKSDGMVGTLKGFQAEFKRITWPSKPDVKKATITVITFCLIYVVFVGLLDGMFSNVVKILFK